LLVPRIFILGRIDLDALFVGVNIVLVFLIPLLIAAVTGLVAVCGDGNRGIFGITGSGTVEPIENRKPK